MSKSASKASLGESEGEGDAAGTGEEEFLIIGGFHTDKDIEDEKIKKPSDVLGTQVGHAYYYLDNVKVTPIAAKSQCACSAADEVRSDLVFGAAAPGPDASADEVVAGSAVYYAFLKRRPTGAGEMAIKRLADLLKDNPSFKRNLNFFLITDFISQNS